MNRFLLLLGVLLLSASGVAAAQVAPVDWCAANGLELKLGPDQGGSGMGKTDTTLSLVNRGSAPCRLRGFLDVREIGQNDAPLGRPAVREGDLGPVVTLAPHGGAALAPMLTVNPGMFDEQACHTVPGKGLRILLPGPDGGLGDPARNTVFLPMDSMLTCAKDVGEPRLRIRSLIPG